MLTISRTPLRITLGGGGSDLAPDGLCVTAAINLYTYVVVNRNRGDEYILKYSDKVERVKELEEIDHPLIHSCLAALNVEPGIEIAWLSDVDGGMGLGSSASFVIGTLRALGMGQEEAVGLAIKLDTGWQDQWACGMGGIQYSMKHASVTLPYDSYWDSRFFLVSTGTKHDTKKVLKKTKPLNQDELVQQAKLAKKYIEGRSFIGLADLMNEQWRQKFANSPTDIHACVDCQMQDINCRGMKLVGAGQGGYILCLSDNKISEPCISIKFDQEGSVVL